MFLLTLLVSITGNILTTSVFYKPTDSHSYLLYSSHPNHTKQSIPFSQFLRLRRLCSEDEDFQSKSLEMREYLVQRGSPTSLLDTAFSKACQIPRSETLSNSVTNVTDHNRTPLVLTFHSFNFKVRDVIRKNFDILRNDPEISSIFSYNPLVSFRHSKNIRETLVHSSLPQELSSPCGTFPCGVGQCKTCKFIDSSTTISAPEFVYHIKHHFTCTSSHLIYFISCSRCGMLYIGETGMEDVWGLGLASTVAMSQATMQTNLLLDTSTMAVIVFLIWKFEPFAPFLVAMIAAKDMKRSSFPNLALSTLLALMNMLVTFNAHLFLSDTLPIDSPSFLFFTPLCPVSHCLVLYYAIRFTFLCLHFVLMKSIWLAFILSRDVFVLTRIKTRMVFPEPHN